MPPHPRLKVYVRPPLSPPIGGKSDGMTRIFDAAGNVVHEWKTPNAPMPWNLNGRATPSTAELVLMGLGLVAFPALFLAAAIYGVISYVTR